MRAQQPAWPHFCNVRRWTQTALANPHFSRLAAVWACLSCGMATESGAINAEELKARVGELRRFL